MNPGKIPRAVKIIPLLTNWEEIVFLTQPENWSPQATGAVTRVFTSNFNEKMAQRYFNLILLPAIRQDIKDNKKLNFHLYLALKKTLYKPTAFFKGLLIPLCESMECTFREATIIGSVLTKVSIPSLPSSVALMKICTMPYSGTNSIFIRTLIDKKYALPYRVIDALVDHFFGFQKRDERATNSLAFITFVVCTKVQRRVDPTTKKRFEVFVETKKSCQNYP